MLISVERCSTGLGTVRKGSGDPGRHIIPSVGGLRPLLLRGGEGVACIHRHPASEPLRGSDARSILYDAMLRPAPKP